MPISTSTTITCDECGRGPRANDHHDAAYFGWSIVRMEHLTTSQMGHNEIDGQPGKVLCDDCRYRQMAHFVSKQDFERMAKSRF